MKSVSFFEQGRFVQSTSSSGDLSTYQREGSVKVSGIYDTSYYYDGKEVRRMSQQPTPTHVFDYTKFVWVDTRTVESQWVVIRNQRATLLQESDWTQLPDVHTGVKEAWATYRQALRDVTLQTDPFNVVWPSPPN